MTKYLSRKGAVAALLSALIAIHFLHLHANWRSSKTEIVEAVYGVPACPEASTSKPTLNLQQVLENRLKLDHQSDDAFHPSIWCANARLHVSFAVSGSGPEQTLGHLGQDLYAHFRESAPPSPCESPGSPQPTAELRLISRNTHVTPWVRPLDLLSLAVLGVAIFLWLRKRGGDGTR